MPNRWHLVVGPTGPSQLRQFLDWVRTAHSNEGTVSAITLRDIDALIRAARAVERQALTAGLVRRAQDWPWGSLVGRLDGTTPLVLVPAPFLESRAWRDYVNAPGDDCEVSGYVPQHPGGFPGGLQGREHIRRV
jgi:putative transposase